MKVCDIDRGEHTTVELKPETGSGFETTFSSTSEVSLFAPDDHESVLLRFGDKVFGVQGIDPQHQHRLSQLIARNLPRLAWVVSALPKGTRNPETIVVEVIEFPSENIWPEPVHLGVDEKTVDAVRRKRKSLVSIDDVVKWLNDKILLPEVGGTNRVLLSGSPTPQADLRSAFRLYGKGVAVDVARDADDKLVVNRVVEARRPTSNDERRPVLLVRGHFQFIDYTVAGRFRGTARTQLDQLVEDADSYLGLWREYNKLERQSILRRAQEFGWMPYSSCRQLSDGRWRFKVDDDGGLEARIRFLEDNELVELEASTTPPPELSQPLGTAEDGENSGRRTRVFAGECTGFLRNRSEAILRPPIVWGEEEVKPPSSGVVFISLSGDRMRLKRREKAQSLIASAECPMPQLGLLIEGKVVPERRRRAEKALSTAARDVFGGEPTEMQIKALKVALNTPDIALVQGPPGTGKTRTIAALQTRLAEITEDKERVSNRALISSYQHDAVENVASATHVFGLPAVKIGRKRGEVEESDGFERWRRERVEAVQVQLGRPGETPLGVALKKCRDLALAYINTPSRSDDIAQLLQDVRDLAGPHIPPTLNDELLERQQSARSPLSSLAGEDDDQSLVLKAVRGLRVDAVTFSDDGPMQARRALRRLEQAGLADSEALELLALAADWDEEEAPTFLDDLKSLQAKLIDSLQPTEPVAGPPLVNADLEALLTKVVDALREKLRSSGGGVEEVLAEYLDDLEYDQRGTRSAVERYTVVLAATCQQAVGYQMSQQKGDIVVFETVVVDEAARANPLDLFIPMSLAERRIILVGDHRQLPHILEHEIERDLDRDVNEKTEEMLRRSLFERLFVAMRKRELADGIPRTVTLNVQYRMHSLLGEFVSDTFYAPFGEAFASGRDAGEFTHDIRHYDDAVAAWVDVPMGRGRESGRLSKRRTAEAKWLAQEVRRVMDERPDFSVGVISFYSAQVDEILCHLETVGLAELTDDGGYRIAETARETRDRSGRLKERLRVGSVDAFQGKEFDVVFLSVTRCNSIEATDEQSLRRKYGHLMLENRLCVAMSRQQRLLVVVGDSAMLQPEAAKQSLRGLVRFYEMTGGAHGKRLRS